MFLAEEAAQNVSTFDIFDLFILAFTVVIAIGVIRSLTAREKNKFAIGFGIVALLVFLFMDFVMVRSWLGIL